MPGPNPGHTYNPAVGVNKTEKGEKKMTKTINADVTIDADVIVAYIGKSKTFDWKLWQCRIDNAVRLGDLPFPCRPAALGFEYGFTTGRFPTNVHNNAIKLTAKKYAELIAGIVNKYGRGVTVHDAYTYIRDALNN